jgi:hypothetical protein
MEALKELFVEPFQGFFHEFIAYLPQLVSAISIFIIGVLISLLIARQLPRLLAFTKLDVVAPRFDIPALLHKGGIREPFSSFISEIIGWIIFVLFTLIAVKALRLTPMEILIERFVLFLPNVFTAVLILLLGYLMANFFRRTVLIAAVNAGVRSAALIGRFVKYGFFFFAITIAMEQLGIGKDTVIITYTITFGGIVLALAIAFGLGGQDQAKTFLKQRLSGEKEGIEHL